MNKLKILVAAAIVIFVGVYLIKSEKVGMQKANACAEFKALSSFVLNTISKPDDIKDETNFDPYDNSFAWRRAENEPLITYPAAVSKTAHYYEYDYEKELRLHDGEYLISAVKSSSDALANLTQKATELGLTVDETNTIPYQSFDIMAYESVIKDYEYLQSFGFTKGDDLYSIVLSAVRGYGAPATAFISVTCGNSDKKYDVLYDKLSLTSKKVTGNPYRKIVGVLERNDSQDVFSVHDNNVKGFPFAYYYLSGEKLELLNNESSPITCNILESKKIGKGMSCTEITNSDPNNYTWINRKVDY